MHIYFESAYDSIFRNFVIQDMMDLELPAHLITMIIETFKVEFY